MLFTGILFGKSFSSVMLTSSLNPSPLGGFVTFTAAVTPLTATGTVTFTDGATTLGTGTISSGTARYTLQTLTPGSHSIGASYGSDARFVCESNDLRGSGDLYSGGTAAGGERGGDLQGREHGAGRRSDQLGES